MSCTGSSNWESAWNYAINMEYLQERHWGFFDNLTVTRRWDLRNDFRETGLQIRKMMGDLEALLKDRPWTCGINSLIYEWGASKFIKMHRWCCYSVVCVRRGETNVWAEHVEFFLLTLFPVCWQDHCFELCEDLRQRVAYVQFFMLKMINDNNS